MPKDERGVSRKISLRTPDDILRRDSETLKQEAIEMGVSIAEIIPAEWVEIPDLQECRSKSSTQGFFYRDCL